MITFSRFENYGRLGNQLFEYASLLGIAHKHNAGVALPHWQWANYFKIPPNIEEWIPTVHLTEPHFHYGEEWLNTGGEHYLNGVVNITGWLQSEKYWQDAKDIVKAHLEFKDEIIERIKELYGYLFYKQTIAITIRRGDYVNNPNYELIPIEYYYLALFEYFPNWKDCNILVFSDDIGYCKIHLSCLDNVFFVERLNPMDQLILGGLCDHFILANSTFSWWLAYLGQKENSKVVYPAYYFGQLLSPTHSTKDFWPGNWIEFDHKGKRIDLTDTTFIIPVHHDSIDRQENFDLSTDNILKYFYTNIIIGEQGSDNFLLCRNNCAYIKFNYDKFHRTKMLNRMTAIATTPIVVNQDCDILTPPLQLLLAVERIRSKEAHIVYPYDGQFCRVPRNWIPTLQKFNDCGMFGNTVFAGTVAMGWMASVGGVLVYDKHKFIQSGGENERMKNYAPEDTERFYRFNKLGYKVDRTKGMCYHLDHQLTKNSTTGHADYPANEAEFHKVKSMTKDELKLYVSTWHYFEPEQIKI